MAISLEDGSIDEEGSIETADGAEDEDVFGVGFIQPHTDGTESGRVNCGRNKLFLDSACTQHTMFAVEYLTGRHTTNRYLKQNCNAGYKLTNRLGYWCGLQFWETKKASPICSRSHNLNPLDGNWPTSLVERGKLSRPQARD